VFQQHFPNTLVTLTAKTPMGILPVTIIRWQVPPRRTGAQNPQYPIEKASVIVVDTTLSTSPAEQMRFKQGPDVI